MLYVTFETMEHEETTNLAEKSTILDGRRRRRRRRRENVEVKPLQLPVEIGVGSWAEFGNNRGTDSQ